MTITTLTIGTRTAISYASIEEADDYLTFDAMLGEEWEEEEDNEKIRRLVSATRRLDLLPWRGEPTGGIAQTNAWPREGLEYPDGTLVADDELPQSIEDVTIILAGAPEIDLGATIDDTSNVRSMTIGPKSEAYFHRNVSRNEILLPDGTLLRIRYWLHAPFPIVGAETFGGESESEFTERKYGKTIEGVY